MANDGACRSARRSEALVGMYLPAAASVTPAVAEVAEPMTDVEVPDSALCLPIHRGSFIFRPLSSRRQLHLDHPARRLPLPWLAPYRMVLLWRETYWLMLL